MSKTFGGASTNASPFDNILRQRQTAFGEGSNAPDWGDTRNSTFGQPASIGQLYRRSDVGMNLPAVLVTDVNSTGNDFTPVATAKDATSVSDTTPPVIKSSLSFNDFSPNPAYDKFKMADTQFGQTFNPDGTTQLTYTAKDFSTCKMTSRNDGTYGITVSDRYGRPQSSEDIDAHGRSTLTSYAYQDANGKPSPWAASKTMKYADGTAETINYDKFGRKVATPQVSEVA